jgi:hypothetical protein
MAYTPGLFEPNKYKPSLMDEVQEELFKEDARKRRQDQWRDNFNKGPVPEADEPGLRDEESRESNEIVQADPVMDMVRIAGMNLPGIDVDKDLERPVQLAQGRYDDLPEGVRKSIEADYPPPPKQTPGSGSNRFYKMPFEDGTAKSTLTEEELEKYGIDPDTPLKDLPGWVKDLPPRSLPLPRPGIKPGGMSSLRPEGMMRLGGPVESQKTSAELWNGIESQYEEQPVQEEAGQVEQTSQIVDTKPWTQKGVPGFFTRGRAVTETFEAISKAASEGKTHEEQAIAFEQGFILPMIQGVWEGVKKYMSTAPTNPETGEVKPESVDAAFENALNFVAPGYARALAAPKGSVELGMVGGRQATGFRKARQEGRTFVGVEGKEKFEFSDKGLEWNIALGKDDPLVGKMVTEGVPLWDAVVHPELRKQYPFQFNDVVVKVDPKMKQGEAVIEDGVVRMSKEDIGTPRGKKVLAHELQHEAQVIENFARGGDLAQFKSLDPVIEEFFTAHPSRLTPQAMESYAKFVKNWEPLQASMIDAFNRVMLQGRPDLAKGTNLRDIAGFINARKERIDNLRFISSLSGEEISFMQALQEQTRYRLYRRLGGETEATNVAYRQDWTDEQRAAKPFASTERFPKSEQMVDPTNLNEGKMLSIEPPKLEAIEGGIPKMEQMLDELNDNLVKALKEGGTVDMSKVDDINFLAKELEKAHKKGEGRKLRLAAKEGEALPETVADDAATKAAQDLFEGKTTIKELPNRFSDDELREQIRAINKRLHDEADTLTDVQKKALVEYRESIINKVKTWQIDTPELDAMIAAEWKQMVEDAKRPRIIEGGKVMKEYLDEMAQRSLDDANRSAHPLSRDYIEDADLVRHKRMLYDRYKDAGRWHDRIVMVAKQMKDSGVDLASKHIKGMQDLIVQRLQEASDLKKIIDSWEYQKSLGLPGPDVATRNKMIPANQPQQRLDKDPVISKDPNQLELDLKPPTSEATRGRAPFLREVKKLVEDDSEITKAIEKITGKKWTDVSRKDWENKLSHDEKHKVFNELVSKDTGGRKDLSSKATPSKDLQFRTAEEDRSFRKLMGQEYERARATSDLSTQYDILGGRLINDKNMPQPMRELIEMERERLYREMGPEGRKAAGIPEDPKSLSAARTPEELIHYDEPFRPKDVPDKYKAKEYLIIDGQTQEIVGAADSRKAASKAAERRNLKYGGHRYHHMKTRWYTNPEEGSQGVGAARTPLEDIHYDEPGRIQIGPDRKEMPTPAQRAYFWNVVDKHNGKAKPIREELGLSQAQYETRFRNKNWARLMDPEVEAPAGPELTRAMERGEGLPSKVSKRLSKKDVAKIHELRKEGLSESRIAQRIGTTVYRVKRELEKLQ